MAGERILHVDDSDLVLHVVHESLKRSGFQVMSAAQLGEIPALLEQYGLPDLIVLDINMPEVQGDDLATFFRDQWGLSAPIVLFSDVARDEIVRLIGRVGASAGIKKEDGVMSLLATIRQELKSLDDTQVTRLPTQRSANPVQSVSDDSATLSRIEPAPLDASVAVSEEHEQEQEALARAGETNGEGSDSLTALDLMSEANESEATLDAVDTVGVEPLGLDAGGPDAVTQTSEPPPPGSGDDLAPPPPDLVPFANGHSEQETLEGGFPAAGSSSDDYVDLDSLAESFAEEEERVNEQEQTEDAELDSLSDGSYSAAGISDEGFEPLGEIEEFEDSDPTTRGRVEKASGASAAAASPPVGAPKPGERQDGTRRRGKRQASPPQGDTKRRTRSAAPGESRATAQPRGSTTSGQSSDTPPRRLRRGPDGTPVEEESAKAAQQPKQTDEGRLALRRGGKGVVLKGKAGGEKQKVPEPAPPTVPQVSPPRSPAGNAKPPAKQEPAPRGRSGGVRIARGKGDSQDAARMPRSVEAPRRSSAASGAAPAGTSAAGKSTVPAGAPAATSPEWQRFQSNLGLWLPRAKRSLKQLQRGLAENKERVWAQAARNLERELRLLVREAKQRAAPALAELVDVLEQQWALYSEDGFDNAKPVGTETAMLRLDTRPPQRRTVAELDMIFADLIELLESVADPKVATVPTEDVEKLQARLEIVDS